MLVNTSGVWKYLVFLTFLGIFCKLWEKNACILLINIVILTSTPTFEIFVFQFTNKIIIFFYVAMNLRSTFMIVISFSSYNSL